MLAQPAKGSVHVTGGAGAGQTRAPQLREEPVKATRRDSHTDSEPVVENRLKRCPDHC